jgi:hypothetical protein
LSVIAPISDLTVVVTGLDEPEADALRLGGITVLTA